MSHFYLIFFVWGALDVYLNSFHDFKTFITSSFPIEGGNLPINLKTLILELITIKK